MGVFAMFRRKSKNPENAAAASAEAEQTAAPSADAPAAAASAEKADEAQSGAKAPESAAADVRAEAAKDAPEAAEAAAGADDTEGTEIPKQQSADEAADNEVGESARK
ncbi:hypothetical protein [Streptomyces cremeus]|uniref:Gliding motility protein n=1 Tax=Streptomyces cremeus TaxID=66881 RepID=A0ABV5P6D6_STRCM